MIEFKALKDKLMTRLEELASPHDLYFYIQSDTGDYKSPTRTNNTVIDYINGLLSLNSSDVSNLTDGTVVATLTARLDLLVRLPDLTADEEYNNKQFDSVTTKINRVRQVLGMLTQSSTQEEMEDSAKVSYSVSTIYQLATSGERAIVANVGDSFTFTIYIYYILVQGGINTKSLVFNLDGVNIPFQAMTMNRSKTFDANVFSNTTDGSVKNMAVQSNWSVTFELPAIQSDFFSTLLNFIFGKDKINTAHCLYFSQGGAEYSKLVNLAEVNLNGETIKNAGLKITFFESVDNYYLIALPATYKVNEIKKDITNATVLFNDNQSGFVFIANDNINPQFIQAGEQLSLGNLTAGSVVISSDAITIF